jgi:hypothetical protein
MANEIEAIARAWMAHQGYTVEQIERAEIQSHGDAGCGYDGYGTWDCYHEDGTSRHPIWDALSEAAEMANVAVAALASIGWAARQL